MKTDRDPADEEAITAVRAHFEEELAEAQVRFGARRLAGVAGAGPAGGGRASGGRAGGTRRFVPRLVASLAVVSVAAIVVISTAWIVARSPATSGETASPSQVPSPVTSASPSGNSAPSATLLAVVPSSSEAPSALPSGPAPNYLAGPVEFNGSMAWIVSDAGLSVSQDGASSWSALALPDGVKPSSVMAVSAAAGRAIWLAAPEGDGVRLYRRAAGGNAWSSTPLMPAWTAQDGVDPVQNIEHVILTPGPSGLVTVSETVGFGTTAAAETLFVSTDDGKSFVHRRPTGSGCVQCYWTSVTFATPKLGVVVAGNSTKYIDVLHTLDGGTTWSLASVGLPPVADYELGSAFMVGSDIEVPVSTYVDNGTPDGITTFFFLISHDGGATFKQAGTALPAGLSGVLGAFDALGQVVWVVGGDTIYESTDRGQTWATITIDGLQSAATGWIAKIHLTGPTSATAEIGQNGCTGFKTGCWSRWYLAATTDGGQTWTNL